MTIKPKNYPVDLKIILSMYSIGFLIGTYTHLEGILINGFLAIGQNAPLFFNIYWDALTLLDPLAAIFVWVKPRLGIGLAVLIMLTNIAINSYSYTTGIFGEPVQGMVPMFLFQQSLFAVFVFVSAPVVIEKLKISFTT